ncbi:hypothetical protein EV426DRAFT_710453 [Tirmania nivea]|nr:hypothetical protein EV426DRAFT_710453 [Tirmania nivea]
MPVSRHKPPPSAPPQTYTCPPPPPLSALSFPGTPPTRHILTPQDHALFLTSPTHTLIRAFISDLNTSIYNMPNSACPTPLPPLVAELSKILDKTRDLVDQHPPEQTASRFGNKSFRGFYDAVSEHAQEWGEEVVAGCRELPEELREGGGRGRLVKEVMGYFCESWGNRTRIDYGSGHELNFICWILCFRQLGLLPHQTYPTLVLHLFLKYLHLARHLQTTYYLEPAGSHGVWGLDDYQFLPFLFGSSQLYSHPHLRPKCIHDDDILAEFSSEYIYLDCILFINSIKTTAGLRWHSPMLDDISGAVNWEKVNTGMKKMYEKEVLGKLAVMQHFLFGTLLPATQGMGEGDGGEEGGHEGLEGGVSMEAMGGKVVVDREGMRHVHSTWGECCGIKVPSAIGAREQSEKQQLRKVPRIPFD